MSNSTAAATSGPAGQPRPASSAPATKRTPSPRSCRNRREPEERRRLARRIARVSLEEADPLGRPVGGEGAADDPVARDGSPEAAVVGSATIVAHHEVVIGGNRDGLREVAALAVPARDGVAVRLL